VLLFVVVKVYLGGAICELGYKYRISKLVAFLTGTERGPKISGLAVGEPNLMHMICSLDNLQYDPKKVAIRVLEPRM